MAVHHVAGGHHVGSGFGIAQSDGRQMGQSGVVEHLPPGVEDAAVAVVGVFAHADVPDDVEVGAELPQPAHGLLHHPFGVAGGSAAGILVVGDAEEDAGGHPGLLHLAGDLIQPVHRVVVDAGQRGDLLFDVLPLHHKDGQYKILRRKTGLPDHGADGGIFAQPPATVKWFHRFRSFHICIYLHVYNDLYKIGRAIRSVFRRQPAEQPDQRGIAGGLGLDGGKARLLHGPGGDRPDGGRGGAG